jgi:hypothetical protein
VARLLVVEVTRIGVAVNVGRWLVLVLVVFVALPAGFALERGRAGHGRRRLVVRLNRPGLAARDNRVNAFGPNPDTTGAIGRGYYLEVVKSRLALFDRGRLRLVAARDANAFWGISPTSDQISDPQVVWDRGARRWYYTAVTTRSPHSLLFAWSRAGDPANLTHGWCRTRIKTGVAFDDFQHLGYSSGAIVIAANSVDVEAGRYLYTRIWVIAKPRRGCQRPPIRQVRIRRVGGRIPASLMPVNPVRPSSVAYVVAADCVDGDPSGEEEASCPRHGRRINVWKVTVNRRVPKLSWLGAVSLATFRVPRPVALPGAAKVDSSDTRLLQAVSAPDPSRHVPVAIWTAHDVAGAGGRSVIRWIELDPRRMRVLRQGTIAAGRNWAFNPAISPTGHGDAAVITYNVAGPSLLPVIRVAFRTSTTPRGIMTATVTLARSKARDARCPLDPGETCPWGDYAAATPDPLRPNVVWGSNMDIGPPTSRGPFHWATQNFAIRLR